jgi:hypothetical protein
LIPIEIHNAISMLRIQKCWLDCGGRSPQNNRSIWASLPPAWWLYVMY